MSWLHASMENYELERLDVDLQLQSKPAIVLAWDHRSVEPVAMWDPILSPVKPAFFHPPRPASLLLPHHIPIGTFVAEPKKKKKKKNPRRRPHAQHRYTSRRAAGTGSGMIRPPIFDLTVLFPSRRGKQPKEKRTWDTVDAGDCDATCQTWQLARVCVNIIVISSGGV